MIWCHLVDFASPIFSFSENKVQKNLQTSLHQLMLFLWLLTVVIIITSIKIEAP